MASRTISTILNLKDNFSETIKNTTQSINSFTGKIKQSESETESMKDKVIGAFSEIGNSILHGIGLSAGSDIWGSTKEGFINMISFGSELQKSLNKVQVAVGYNDKSMASMKDIMTDIYNENFGQNFEDIGEAIKIIGQQTGETGNKLKGLTEDALSIKDAFGFDVNESIRSANMMMKQFGLTGEQAYNLITQGAQWGLNKNGDLLDTINEYSVHFKQLGIGADEMMNMLVNGADSGTFSVDKLGDAVKEFGIRAKDGSSSTSDAFTELGFDVQGIESKFSQGGETAKQAFTEVNKKLLEMKDPLKQNQIGVELYGTMWEDLGTSGIKALTDMRGEISNTNNALKDINNIQYSNIGSAFEGIKRNLQTGILLPISDEVLPRLSDFSKWFIDNMPVIKETVKELTQKFIDLASPIGDVVAHSKDVYNFINDNWGLIGPIVDTIVIDILAWKAALIAIDIWTGIVAASTAIYETIALAIWGVKNATSAWEAAQWLLNVALDANPIGVTIAALSALGLAIYEVVTHWQDICRWIEKAWNWLTTWNGTKAEDKSVTFTQTRVDDNRTMSEKAAERMGKNALGTSYWRGGSTSINEHGGEIIDLPNGSRVIPADKSASLIKNSGGHIFNFNFTGNVGTEEFFDKAGDHICNKVILALNNM